MLITAETVCLYVRLKQIDEVVGDLAMKNKNQRAVEDEPMMAPWLLPHLETYRRNVNFGTKN